MSHEDIRDLAGQFFARGYPEEAYRVADCHSWLLDPQLARCLPGDSDIRRSQERFHLASEPAPAEGSGPIGFVFGDPELPPESLPRRTTLERAIGDHLRAGRHRHCGHGWFQL